MNLRLEVKRSVATLNDPATGKHGTRESEFCQTKTLSYTRKSDFSTIGFADLNVERLISSRRVWHASSALGRRPNKPSNLTMENSDLLTKKCGHFREVVSRSQHHLLCFDWVSSDQPQKSPPTSSMRHLRISFATFKESLSLLDFTPT